MWRSWSSGGALSMTLHPARRHPLVERWTARWISDDASSSITEELFRLTLDDPEWTDALSLLSPTAREVGQAFVDMRSAATIDQEVLYADSLVICDGTNGDRTLLLGAVATVFRNDIVATTGNVHEAPSHQFAGIPDTRVVMLPFYNRR